MQDSRWPAEPVESDMDAVGGEVLTGSGFETEEADVEFEDSGESVEE